MPRVSLHSPRTRFPFVLTTMAWRELPLVTFIFLGLN